MLTRLAILVVALLGAASSNALARDTRYFYPIRDALNTPAAREKLGPEVAFYFGDQAHPRVERTLGEYVSNRKTNALNKSDREACEWVFLSALLALRQRAVQEGGNAVIKITSYYKKNDFVSATEYECHAGALIAGVALKGTVVKLAR